MSAPTGWWPVHLARGSRSRRRRRRDARPRQLSAHRNGGRPEIYLAAVRNGDASNFFGAAVSTTPVTVTVTAPHPDPRPGRPPRAHRRPAGCHRHGARRRRGAERPGAGHLHAERGRGRDLLLPGHRAWSPGRTASRWRPTHPTTTRSPRASRSATLISTPPTATPWPSRRPAGPASTSAGSPRATSGSSTSPTHRDRSSWSRPSARWAARRLRRHRRRSRRRVAARALRVHRRERPGPCRGASRRAVDAGRPRKTESS